MTHHRIVIIGGGNAGLSVAGRLHRHGVDDVVVIEPRDQHRFQPLFSHAAGGVARASMTVRSQASVMPKGVGWIQEAVADLDPDAATVMLASGRRVTYDQLIVCPGMQLDWDRVPGLTAALSTPAVASHYEFELVPKASRLLRDLRRGTAVFTQPPGPAKCAGASQKPMYLACDYWRATGVLSDIRVVMIVPDPTVFGIPEIDRELERKIAEYGIELRMRNRAALGRRREPHGRDRPRRRRRSERAPAVRRAERRAAPVGSRLAEVDEPARPPAMLEGSSRSTPRRSATCATTTSGRSATPPRPATPSRVARCASRPRSVAENVLAVLDGKEPTTRYDGYTVCPFTVSRSTVVFAEFDDQYRLKPTIPFWKSLSRERRLSWLFDRHILPWVYWHMILKGRA